MLNYTTKSVSTDSPEMGVHKIGTDVYAPNAMLRVPGDKESDYEEVPMAEVNKTRVTEEMRSQRISQLVHRRYTLDAEVALLANINAPALLDNDAKAAEIAQEYAAYQAYRAECKAQVDAEIAAGTFK